MPDPDPNDASLGEAIDHLRSGFGGMIDQLVQGQLAIWAGSMLSGARFPPLRTLLSDLLDLLFKKIDVANPACPYRAALDEVLSKVPKVYHGPSGEPPSNWPMIHDVTSELQYQYSKVLDLTIDLPTPQTLAELLDLPTMYSNPSIEPDAEHRMLALLVLEHAVVEIVSTNWDQLIEKAYDATQVPSRNYELACVVHPDDLLTPRHKGRRLSKIHGCARRALDRPKTHKGLLVASHNDILKWSADTAPIRVAIREHAESILKDWPMVFTGSSGQDTNLQELFVRMSSKIGPFGKDPPRFRFASGKLEEPHQHVLRAVYGEAFSKSYFQEHSVVGLYAKPLLIANLHLSCRQEAARHEELFRTRQQIERLKTIEIEIDGQIDDAKKLVKHANELKTKVINEVLDKSLNELWNDLFERLAKAEPFRLTLKELKHRYGKLKVEFEANHSLRTYTDHYENPESVLSSGNLNTAALSLFLALNLNSPSSHQRQVLVLDDPVQNMDDVHVVNLAELLRSVVRETGRQVIIAVHERPLFEYLSLEFSPANESESLITIELDRDPQTYETKVRSTTHKWRIDRLAFA